jgi:aquaporin Z
MYYYNNLLAEYLGALLLVLSIFASGGNPAFVGLTLGVIIFLCGKTNPGHVNPAVTIAMYIKKRLSIGEVVGFIVAQVLGGITSVYLFNALA